MGAEVALPVLLATVVFTAIGHDGLPQSSRWRSGAVRRFGARALSRGRGEGLMPAAKGG